MVNVKRIPIIGNDIYQVGQVYNIFAQPCAPTPTIWVEAFFANIPMLVWSFVKPDPTDYLTERFGSTHKRRRKNRFRVDEIDIGKPANGKGYLRWISFTGTRIAERIGWYFLVIDATTDFAVNWTSMAYRYTGCQDPTSGYATSDADVPTGYFSNGSPRQMAFGTAAFSTGFFANTSNVGKLTNGPYGIGSTINFKEPNNDPVATIQKVELRDTSAAARAPIDIPLGAAGPGYQQQASRLIQSFDVFDPPANFQLWITASPGWVNIENWRMSMSGWSNQGLAPDP